MKAQTDGTTATNCDPGQRQGHRAGGLPHIFELFIKKETAHSRLDSASA